jgi:excisionase family DNA binding protein
MTKTLEPLLDVREVARLYKLSTAHVRRLHARGDLPAVRFSPAGHLRFRPADVEQALAGHVCGCGTSVREAVEPARPAGGSAPTCGGAGSSASDAEAA